MVVVLVLFWPGEGGAVTTKPLVRPVFAALYGVMSRQMEAGPIGAARRELVFSGRL
jgi:hypothetical protein